MFVDRVKLKLRAGNGGNGIVSFRREKYVPLGGPNGGDGGNGGSIIFQVDSNKSTLLDLRYNRLISAKNGGVGKTKKMHGAAGEDVVIRVPIGTIVKDSRTGAIIADLTQDEQSAIIAKGGKGGKGNWHFATSRNSAPEFCEMGQPGEEKEVEVELKLLADVGLVGFPSVGKSTLLSVVSAAKPEIAEYPFTTLVPNLGVVQVKDGRSFVMADLPGLIEGAAEGKGLGHQFLRHIERCRVLIHILDMSGADGRDPIEDYEIINKELSQYQMRLLERPQIILANKMDMEKSEENLERFKNAYPNLEIFPTCTIIHEGVDEVLYRAADLLAVTPEFPLYNEEENKSEGVLFKFEPKSKPFTIQRLGEHLWNVEGERIQKLFEMSRFETEMDAIRFGNELKKLGVDDALREAGVAEGDIVGIADYQFEFTDEVDF